MPDVDINWAAVIIATVVNMVIGGMWYAKSGFGKQWAKLTGRKMEEMTGGASGYGIALVGALVQSWIFAHFIVYAGSTSFFKGLMTGFWLWLAFVAITSAVHYSF